MNGFTPNQERVIRSRGNVLVRAGAGAGKTRTLVERCVAWLLESSQHSIDQVLMVTFTDAAAAEMRHRIRSELTKRLDLAPAADQPRLSEQLALLDTASISTLHGFCLSLIRQNFYNLEIDPQTAVLPEEEARLLADETLSSLLDSHYAGFSHNSDAVQNLIETQGRGWDRPIRSLILRIHHYAQTLPDPAAWFVEQRARFQNPEPEQWRLWLEPALRSWRELWLPFLESHAQQGNPNAETCAALLRAFPPANPLAEAPALFLKLSEASQQWPARKKTELLKPLAEFYSEAEFLHSLFDPAASRDPLAEDWLWVREPMAALIDLTQEFTAAFQEAKRELGVMDFHDLEQFSLRLLWDPAAQRPTPLAEFWRQKFSLVCVDEYQDINAAQDAILAALSREGDSANRFLVGDVKQSIYRFRLAAPHIFQRYASHWRQNPPSGQVISLSDNFRSHEGILAFINPFFAQLMRPEIGGVEYDPEAWLLFGNPSARTHLAWPSPASAPADLPPSFPNDRPVELHLRLTGEPSSEEDANEPESSNPAQPSPIAELSAAETEARLIGLRLLELKNNAHPVWDPALERHRPLEWNDVVVLLRSPKNKAESFAKAFSMLGIPLLAAKGGFFEAPEVMDLLALLALLDNPLQDVPALAVLHSPLVGLSVNDLALIRLAHSNPDKTPANRRFWTALRRFHQRGPSFTPTPAPEADIHPSPPPPSRLDAVLTHNAALALLAENAWRKVDQFLKRFAVWRRLAREHSLSDCLERILQDTHYDAWLSAQPRGEQRQANLPKLLAWARQFDRFQRQGLFRFLNFVEAQKNADIDHEPALAESENAVRLMSIHQSKGLEFPVVVLADLGKKFNFSDLSADLILDEVFGLCPKVKPPSTEQRYPSLAFWLARRRQHTEGLGEEMRLLYVAMTRACQKLILAGSFTRSAAEKNWIDPAPAAFSTRQVLKARCYLDWLGPWLAAITDNPSWPSSPQGASPLFAWRIHTDADATSSDPLPSLPRALNGPADPDPDPAAVDKLRAVLEWTYPFAGAAREPAKASVSDLRRRIAEDHTEAQIWKFAPSTHPPRPTRPSDSLSPAEIGTAHHLFLQYISLEMAASLEALQIEADRLQQEGILSPMERRHLDLPGIHRFWNGPVGAQIVRELPSLHRELPFTIRLSPAEFGALSPLGANPARLALEGEFILVQGVVDLAVILPSEIWILDFKTDAILPSQAEQRLKEYHPQLNLYALALSRIYKRPITQCWIHFLALHSTFPVSVSEPSKR